MEFEIEWRTNFLLCCLQYLAFYDFLMTFSQWFRLPIYAVPKHYLHDYGADGVSVGGAITITQKAKYVDLWVR